MTIRKKRRAKLTPLDAAYKARDAALARFLKAVDLDRDPYDELNRSLSVLALAHLRAMLEQGDGPLAEVTGREIDTAKSDIFGQPLRSHEQAESRVIVPDKGFDCTREAE